MELEDRISILQAEKLLLEQRYHLSDKILNIINSILNYSVSNGRLTKKQRDLIDKIEDSIIITEASIIYECDETIYDIDPNA